MHRSSGRYCSGGVSSTCLDLVLWRSAKSEFESVEQISNPSNMSLSRLWHYSSSSRCLMHFAMVVHTDGSKWCDYCTNYCIRLGAWLVNAPIARMDLIWCKSQLKKTSILGLSAEKLAGASSHIFPSWLWWLSIATRNSRLNTGEAAGKVRKVGELWRRKFQVEHVVSLRLHFIIECFLTTCNDIAIRRHTCFCCLYMLLSILLH